MQVYTRIVRKCKNNIRIELPNKETLLIPKEDLCNWECVDNSNKKKNEIKNEIIKRVKVTKTIVGIDPSYTRTGIAIITKDKHIVFHTLSEQIGKKDFIHTYNSAHTLALQLKEYLTQFGTQLLRLAAEEGEEEEMNIID